jgi:hypothetical protein
MSEMTAAQRSNDAIADIPTSKALLFQVLLSVILDALERDRRTWRDRLDCLIESSRSNRDLRIFALPADVGSWPTLLASLKIALSVGWRQGQRALNASQFEEKGWLICSGRHQVEGRPQAEPVVARSLANWEANSLGFVEGVLQVKCSQT